MSTHTANHVAHHFDDADQQFEAARLGMWLFLVTEVLFFGGLLTGYAVYRAFYYDADYVCAGIRISCDQVF